MEHCSDCDGQGFKFIDEETARVCPKCKGKGVVDFITNVLGPRPLTVEESLQEIISSMAEKLAEQVDEDIMGQLLGDKRDRNI